MDADVMILARVIPRVIRNGTCWIWTGATSGPPRPVGRMRYQNQGTSPHRLMYEAIHGPIPEGLQIDHLCRRPLCCNPMHLEAVTGMENSRRAWADKTHCPQGHAYTDEPPLRKCRKCHRDRESQRRARQ